MDKPSVRSMKPVVTYSPLKSSVTHRHQVANSLGHGLDYAGLKFFLSLLMYTLLFAIHEILNDDLHSTDR